MIIVLSWAYWRSKKTRLLIGRARDSSGSKNMDENSTTEGSSGEKISEIGQEGKTSVREKMVDLLRRRRGKNLFPRDMVDI